MTKVYPFFKGHVFNNWHASSFVVDETTYNCGEQWMMAQKALVFKDMESYDKIMTSQVPASMKAYGKRVKNFDEKEWSQKRYGIVRAGLRQKFLQNSDLLAVLLGTGDKEICEASPYDKIWGIGVDARHPDINAPSKWQGQNLLGKILMNIREEIRLARQSL